MKKISKKIIDSVFQENTLPAPKNDIVKAAENILNGDCLPVKNGTVHETIGYSHFIGTTYDPITGAEFPQRFVITGNGECDQYFLRTEWPEGDMSVKDYVEFLIVTYCMVNSDKDTLMILGKNILDIHNYIGFLATETDKKQ